MISILRSLPLKWVFAACLLIACRAGNAQNSSIAEAHLGLDSISPSEVACTFIVKLSDTVGVSQVEISLGHSPGDTSLIHHVFDFDVTTGLPAGFAWQREGKRIELAAGTAQRHPTWFGRVRLKDYNETWTQPKIFVRN